MKALSIRQPWAWLIVNAADYPDPKLIENRSWSTNHRGPTLIHASREIDREAHDDLVQGIHPVTGERTMVGIRYPGAFRAPIETGGIVGIAEIHGCVTQSDSEWFVGKFGFLIRNARPLPFQPCLGKLGFFTPDREIDTRALAEPAGQGRLL